jgi:hypothetical protein
VRGLPHVKKLDDALDATRRYTKPPCPQQLFGCLMLKPGLTGWREQYDRMMRVYERLQKPYHSAIEYYDDLHHFFQDCWHLKDWIKNDPSAGIGRAIENEVKCRTFDVVADLANAAKHLVRHQRTRVGAYGTSTDVTATLAPKQPIHVVYTITLADGSQIEAQDLIRSAVAEWQAILVKIGLPPP